MDFNRSQTKRNQIQLIQCGAKENPASPFSTENPYLSESLNCRTWCLLQFIMLSLGNMQNKDGAAWINNKVLLYSTGNYVQYSMINHSEKGYEKNIYVYIWKEYICIIIYIIIYKYESLCSIAEINIMYINYTSINF